MLGYAKSGTIRTGDRLNGFKKGQTQQFNSGGVVKWAYFQKKWSITLSHKTDHQGHWIALLIDINQAKIIIANIYATNNKKTKNTWVNISSYWRSY